MNRFLLFFFISFLIISCAREDFQLTKIKISFDNKEILYDSNYLNSEVGSYGYFFHLYNPVTGFYKSRLVGAAQRVFELAVPNDPNYIIYAFKTRSIIGEENSMFVTEKSFFQKIDLSSGGVIYLDLELSDQNFLTNEYTQRQLININVDTRKAQPMKILFRPCGTKTPSDLNLDSCPLLGDSSEGSIQSMRINFYQHSSIGLFNPAEKIWGSNCISKQETDMFFDPMIKIPINNKYNRLMFLVDVSLYFDKRCQHVKYQTSFNKGFPLLRETLKILPDELTDPETGIDYSVANLIFIDQKQSMNEKCFDNFNCASDRCLGNICQ